MTKKFDVECIGYCLMLLVKGTQNWKDMRPSLGHLHNIVWENAYLSEKKIQPSKIHKLLINKPKQFTEYMAYVEKLALESDPDYDYLINLLRNCLIEQQFDPVEPKYIWNQLEQNTPYIKLNLKNEAVKISADYQGDYGEECHNLVDPDTSEHCKWIKANSENNKQGWVVIELPNPTKISAVGFKSANDNPARDPSSFSVSVANGD